MRILAQPYPDSIKHWDVHPSPFLMFPSSQSSLELIILFPQVWMHVSGVVALPPEQVYPNSLVHVLEHPSPSIRLPSSQSSVVTLRPSPHIAVQMLFVL